MVNLYPINNGDATLSVLEKSHKYHKDFFNYINYKKPEDYFELFENEIKYFTDRKCKQVCVKAPVGSLILWDSRTMHQGIKPHKDRKHENLRMVIYICMLPRNRFSKQDLKNRKEAFENLRMTNNWGTKMFSKSPTLFIENSEDYEKNFNKPPHPKLTEYGKKLIC